MRSKARLGFTWWELLVIVAILIVLVAILFPVFATARREARLARCSDNLHQIGQALGMYLNDYGELPDPTRLVRSVPHRQSLTCPEVQRPECFTSSYLFRTLVPPDYQPYWEQRNLDPNTVVAVCDRHLEPGRREGGAWQAPPSQYPLELALRANGVVSRLRQDTVREIFRGGDRPFFSHVYPGERCYHRARR